MRLALAAALLVGCGDPVTTELPQSHDAWQSDETFRKAYDKLESEDQKRLERYRERYLPDGPMGGVWSPGTQIRHALEEQARWDERRQAERAEKAKKDAAEAEKRAALDSVLAVRLKSVDNDSAESTLSVTFELRNNEARQIKGVQGKAVLMKKSGSTIIDVPVLLGEPIGGKSTMEWTYNFDRDPGSASQRGLITTPQEEAVVVWKPERIAFSDGTLLSMD